MYIYEFVSSLVDRKMYSMVFVGINYFPLITRYNVQFMMTINELQKIETD